MTSKELLQCGQARGGAVVCFYNGDGLTVIEQRLQGACQLLALVVRQLGQAVDQTRHLLLSHGLLLRLTHERHALEMGAQRGG